MARIFFTMLIFALIGGCTGTTAKREVTPLPIEAYTKYNLWFERSSGLNYLSYKRGKLILAGTGVSELKHFRANADRPPHTTFKRASDHKKFTIVYRPRFHPESTFSDYQYKLFSYADNFEKMTRSFNANEIEAIRKGQLIEGMSGSAVVMSWGWPGEHQTPDLAAVKWYFHPSRRGRKTICFGPDKRTIHCEKLKGDQL